MRHYLTENKTTRVRGQMVFLAVAGEEHSLSENGKHSRRSFFGGHCRFARWEDGRWTREQPYWLESPEKFWLLLDSYTTPHRPITVWGYSIGEAATMLDLWSQVDAKRYKLLSVVDADPPIIIRIKSERGNVTFLDVRNFLRSPLGELALSEIGDTQELTSVADVMDLMDSDLSIASTAIHCIVSSLVEFIHIHNLGVLKNTAAAQSMAAYRHRLGQRIKIKCFNRDSGEESNYTNRTAVLPMVHDNEETTELERLAGYGGEANCYFVGEIVDTGRFWEVNRPRIIESGRPYIYGPVYHLDCNSLFGSVMRDYKMPCELVGIADNMQPSQLETIADSHCCIATVRVKCDTVTYPCRHTGRIIYPTGRYWTTLTGVELHNALIMGRIENVSRAVWYKEWPLFREYIGFFADLRDKYRQQNNGPYADLAKLFMNSLYGKWAERPRKWTDRPDIKPRKQWGIWYEHDAQTKKLTWFRSLAGLTQERIVAGTLHHAFPAITAAISAAAREHMRNLRFMAGKRNVLFQCVDSLIVTPEGLEQLSQAGQLHPTDLGKLRVLGDYRTGVINDIYDYQLGEKRKAAGLPDNAKRIKGDQYEFSQRDRLGSTLAAGPGKAVGLHHVNATFHSRYRGGQISNDGWVQPFYLDQGNDYA